MYRVPSMSAAQQEQQRALFTQVYGWMAGGLALTSLIAMWAFSSGFVINIIRSNLMLPLLIAELVLVFGLSWAINRISVEMAAAGFLLYSALNGLTLSVIFLVYTQASIASTFIVTAGTFALTSIYGHTTKRDLTTWGSMLFMALIGLILASIVNLFLRSEALYWLLSYAGVLIFVALTAYDTQKIKNMGAQIGYNGGTAVRRLAIFGALTLYLDFINLFLYLLRILGRRR